MLKRSIRYVLGAAALMGLLFALFPDLILLLYGVDDPQSAEYISSCLRIYALAFPGLGFTLLMNYYFQAIRKQKLSTGVTVLEGLILPVGLACALTPHFGMSGIWTALIASEVGAVLFILIYLRHDRLKSRGYDRQKSRAPEERVFLLPKSDDRRLCGFSVKTDIPEIVEKTKEVSQYIEDRTDHRTAVITCLALEEMLTGITMANNDREEIIDVMLRETETDVIISLRDMGIGFNPLVRDKSLSYDFDNAQVLQSIASEIRFDLSLGMNDTMIRLSRKK